MRLYILILIVGTLGFYSLAQRRALRVLSSEAKEIIELEKVVMQAQATYSVSSNKVDNIVSHEIHTFKTNALLVAQDRVKFEDYALDREGGTNNVADIQAARLKILEVQHVD